MQGGWMHRRIGFIVSICGMVFVMLPLGGVLGKADFVTAAIGFAFVIIGIFFAIESLARGR